MESGEADDTGRRGSWLDDLATAAAAGLLTAPRAWIAGLVALVVLVGPLAGVAGVAVQIAATVVAIALVRRRTPRQLGFPLWLLPGTAVLVVAAAASSPYARDRLPIYLPAIVAGLLLAGVGSWRGRRLHPVAAGSLLGGAVIWDCVRTIDWEVPWQVLEALDALSWPIGLAAAALAMWPSPRATEATAPRRAPTPIPSWALWWLVPGIVVGVPASLQPGGPTDVWTGFAALALVHAAARVAATTATAAAPDGAAAMRRLAIGVRASPWSASALAVGGALLWLVVWDATHSDVFATLELLRPKPLWDPVDPLSMFGIAAIPAAIALGVVAHGPFRALRGRDRLAPWLAVTAIWGLITVPWVAAGIRDAEFPMALGAVGVGLATALLPLATGLLPPRAPRGGMLLLLCLLTLAATTIAGRGIWTSEGNVLGYVTLLLTVPVLVLFHAVARAREGRQHVFAGAVTLFVVTAAVLAATPPSDDVFGLPRETLLTSVPPLDLALAAVGTLLPWLVALVPLAFARALHRAELAEAAS